MAIKRVKYEDIKKQKGRTTKKDLDGMQNAEVIERAISNLDSPVPTETELNEFERVGCKECTQEKIMSKKIQVNEAEIKNIKGRSDWPYLKQQTDEQIYFNAGNTEKILSGSDLKQLHRPKKRNEKG